MTASEQLFVRLSNMKSMSPKILQARHVVTVTG
jgi:hypothetical protein